VRLRGEAGINRREFLKKTALAGGAGMAKGAFAAAGRSVSIVRPPGDPVAAAAPVEWAVQELEQALKAHGVTVQFHQSVAQARAGGLRIVVAGATAGQAAEILKRSGERAPTAAESLALAPGMSAGRPLLLATAADPRGLIYALLELADRVNHAEDPFEALEVRTPLRESPANAVRSVDRCFLSDVEDKPWYNDRSMWPPYLTMLATHRFNRFTLSFGMGYDYPHRVTDAYFYFPYPFLLAVPGYKVRAVGLADEERDQNLKMLRWISDQTAARGLDFHLGLWTHAYQWPQGSEPNYTIEGLTPETHAPYCRDALRALLEACPNISGLALRIHGESGIPEANLSFWETVFAAIPKSGRRIEINMHAKGMSQPMIDRALAVGVPVTISPKYWAEHCGLPYQPSSIRQLEMPATNQKQEGFFSLSSGARRFLRYSYGDLLKQGRRYGVIYRIWPGTQRCLLWGDPVMAAAGARTASFCGSQGIDLLEPLSFKGRHGSGVPGGRCAYADETLNPRYDWEKFLYTYRVWGRHLYNPDTPPNTWRRLLRKQFGAASLAAEEALSNASRILRLVLAAHGPSAANNSYWPEIYTNMPIVDETKNHLYPDALPPRIFTNVSPFDPEIFARINEFAVATLKGEPRAKYSPLEVAEWLEDFADAADKSLAAAKARSRNPRAPDFRRMAVDVRIQSCLGRFFAWKLRSGTLYELYQQSGDTAALEEALKAYRRARTHWADAANQAKGVYLADITYGSETNLRGCWLDRLPAIDDDIRDMENRLARAKQVAAPAESTDREKVQSAVREVLSRPTRPSLPCRHTVPAHFEPGQPVRIELSVEPRSGFEGITVRLHYRHVNQGEYYVTQEMPSKANLYAAVIPGSYTNSPYGLQYFFELRTRQGGAWLFPGLGAHLSTQPYFVVQQE
jgi:hypothetical protein